MDFNKKIDCFRNIIAEKNAGALIINSQVNFSYLTRGKGYIGLASTIACGSIIITLKDVYLVADNIEAQRLKDEQLTKTQGIIIKEYPWDDPEQKAKVMDEILKGCKVLDEAQAANEIFKIRTVLTDEDLKEYEALCLESAIILENICKGLKPGVSECELAGEISKKLWEKGLEPITILIGFDERAQKYRHPVFTDKKLKHYAMVAICTRKNGLICSVTRNVLLGYDAKMIEKHEKCAYVDAVFTAGLKEGRPLSDIYKEAIKAYASQGYEGEYKYHHQGGLTGFMPRELKANIDAHHVVRVNEAYAFNPSIQGAKSEDTVVVTKDGLKNLTYTGNYAYVEINIDGKTYKKPTVYVKLEEYGR
ncbi:MAG: M24 family metallopeptidase [Clostridia bacterium]|nr:M24 family metallopeptidase [Clostridia bacterium]